MHGLRMFNTTRIQKLFDTHLSNYRPITDYELNYDNERNKTVQTFTHREAIELLKERYKEVTYKL